MLLRVLRSRVTAGLGVSNDNAIRTRRVARRTRVLHETGPQGAWMGRPVHQHDGDGPGNGKKTALPPTRPPSARPATYPCRWIPSGPRGGYKRPCFHGLAGSGAGEGHSFTSPDRASAALSSPSGAASDATGKRTGPDGCVCPWAVAGQGGRPILEGSTRGSEVEPGNGGQGTNPAGQELASGEKALEEAGSQGVYGSGRGRRRTNERN